MIGKRKSKSKTASKATAGGKATVVSKAAVVSKATVVSKPVVVSKPAAVSKPVVVSKPAAVSKPVVVSKATAVSQPAVVSKPVAGCKVTPPAVVPRARDRERTRALILHEARRSFATLGYAQSGMREIAAAAGITPALVVRYFGSKEQLFEVAVGEDLGIEHFVIADRSAMGRHVVEHLVGKPPPEADSLAILLLAATDPSLSPLVRRLTHERMMAPLVAWLGGAHAESRAAQLLAVVAGAWLFRHLLPVAPLAGEVDRATLTSLAAIVQGLVDGKR